MFVIGLLKSMDGSDLNLGSQISVKMQKKVMDSDDTKNTVDAPSNSAM